MTVGFIVMGVAGFGSGHAVRPDRRPPRRLSSPRCCSAPVSRSPAAAPPISFVFQLAYGGLVGASGGAFFAPIISTTLGWFDKNRSLAISLVSIGGGVAPMVITPLASLLIETYGWRSAMLTIAIAATVIVVPTTPSSSAAPPTPPSLSPHRRNLRRHPGPHLFPGMGRIADASVHRIGRHILPLLRGPFGTDLPHSQLRHDLRRHAACGRCNLQRRRRRRTFSAGFCSASRPIV